MLYTSRYNYEQEDEIQDDEEQEDRYTLADLGSNWW